MLMNSTCPLCSHPEIEDFHRDTLRSYRRCPQCALIFAARSDLLPPKAEKARYDLHENNPEDPGYRRFLRQLADPLLARLGTEPLKGLDYGSGPGPTLSLIMEEYGHKMTLYDPYFAPQTAVLDERYDFITSTEVFEHFYSPQDNWSLLLRLLRPDGWLGIMTELIDNPESFPHWHYKEDQTHVSFFSRRTFSFLAKRDRLSVEFIGDNIILIRKSTPIA